MKELPNVEESYAVELARKGIHLLSLSIPIVYYYIEKSTALAILVPLTFLFLSTDLLRQFHRPSRLLYHKYFAWLLRAHERTDHLIRLNGATYVLLSAVVCMWIFPKLIFITAFAMLIVSDTSAALIGRRFGSRPFLNKSLAGAMAFFISGFLVVLIAPKAENHVLEYCIGILGAGVGTFVESFSTAVDDNLSIPISIGVLMWLMYALLLPDVNISVLDAIH
jgi:dolichol kinase